MNRNIQIQLEAWKEEKGRKPLIIRGARQVGKSYTVGKFGREKFETFIEINFELQPELKGIFNTLNPQEIIKNINLALNENIIPGKTLLFLDEIQECLQAITAMRYFYEKMPQLHVIGAGSLLEFSLTSGHFEVPVGRVQYLYMYPLSFDEFLEAVGEMKLRDYLKEARLDIPLNEAIHLKALHLLRAYLLVGGMPDVINTYLACKTSTDYQKVQLIILQTYRDDFGKYSSRVKHIYLQKVFNSAPILVGQKYKYANVDREIPSRELKEALYLLSQAGVITKICSTSAHGLPFSIHSHENKFKIAFLDVGLMQRSCGLDAQLSLTEDFIAVNSGSVAEQFIAQELIAYQDPYDHSSLYYWRREKRNSAAEVDYLFQARNQIVPVEVKSGVTGSLKSLKLFMKEHSSRVGVRFSQLPMSFHDGILSLPLYCVSAMPRLLESVMS